MACLVCSSKPESSAALLPVGGQGVATGPVTSEPLPMESGDPAQPAGSGNANEASLNSMQLQHLDQHLGQQIACSAASVPGQQQSLPYPGAYHIEPSPQPLAQT